VVELFVVCCLLVLNVVSGLLVVFLFGLQEMQSQIYLALRRCGGDFFWFARPNIA
jgi:hypothetical protein